MKSAKQILLDVADLLESLSLKPISSSPKYPISEYGFGPRFIAIDPEWGAIAAHWAFPQQGSIAYRDNYPPKIEAINGYRGAVVYLHPTHWIPTESDHSGIVAKLREAADLPA